jgi:N-acetylglucosaminyldiphosphoundecaprenol N-acetyl-beta-D-mannosaminyltransferase
MLKTERVLGLPVTVGSTENIAEMIAREANRGHAGYVCVANVHMVTTARRNEKLRKIMEKALLVTADGLPLVWMLKQGGFKEAERVTGTDLTLKLCETAAEERIPVYFYGGYPETIKALKTFIAEKFPDLNVVGYESPPLLSLQPELDHDVVSRITNSGARIVFIGLGCPKQEFWMAMHTSSLPAILIGVGAAFDFIAGTVSRAPLWMQKYGLEWLHRLAEDPQKTWKRYTTTNPLFIWMVIKKYVKRKAQRAKS